PGPRPYLPHLISTDAHRGPRPAAPADPKATQKQEQRAQGRIPPHPQRTHRQLRTVTGRDGSLFVTAVLIAGLLLALVTLMVRIGSDIVGATRP
ncbi:MAG: hypothetical protein ACRDUV_06005, partial [Pseudonocardiaceae bacterium]